MWCVRAMRWLKPVACRVWAACGSMVAQHLRGAASCWQNTFCCILVMPYLVVGPQHCCGVSCWLVSRYVPIGFSPRVQNGEGPALRLSRCGRPVLVVVLLCGLLGRVSTNGLLRLQCCWPQNIGSCFGDMPGVILGIPLLQSVRLKGCCTSSCKQFVPALVPLTFLIQSMTACMRCTVGVLLVAIMSALLVLCANGSGTALALRHDGLNISLTWFVPTGRILIS